jgi:hypothetical protein
MKSLKQPAKRLGTKAEKHPSATFDNISISADVGWFGYRRGLKLSCMFSYYEAGSVQEVN